MTGPVRVGVLGCSAIARRRTIPALRECDATTPVAVASRDPGRAATFAAEFGLTAMTYDELVDAPDVDALYVPLPAGLHLDWGLRALRAGKHVLLEKPAACSAADVRTLVAEAGQRGLVLRENFTFDHHGQHRTVQELVDGGRLGALRGFSAAFCFPPLPADDIRYDAALGGGALLDAGVYPLRAAQRLVGPELEVLGSVLGMDADRGVDVSGSALLVSPTGVTVDVSFGFRHSYGAWYSLWGSTGRLHLDRAFTPPATLAPVLRIEEQDHGEQLTLRPEHQFLTSVASFADAVRAAQAAGVDAGASAAGEQGVRTLELVDEIARRARRIEVARGN